MAPERIVVGYDGSPGSTEALRWATEEARLRGARLEVLHAWMVPLIDAVPPPYVVGLGPLGPSPEAMHERARKEAEALVATAAETLESANVAFEAFAVESRAAKALLDAAAGAALLVVGSRGRGGFAGLLLGSVSQQCAHHAPCPIVIVPAR
jgi:nucleotide-binding universal stress UspA family protein